MSPPGPRELQLADGRVELSWIGGEAFHTLFIVLIPGWTGLFGAGWAGSRSQREQVIGQVTALPTTMTAFAAMGILITSATVLLNHRPIWDPIELVGRFRDPLVVAVSTIPTSPVITPPVLRRISRGNAFAKSLAGDTTLAAMLTASVATTAANMDAAVAAPRRSLWLHRHRLLGYSGGLGSTTSNSLSPAAIREVLTFPESAQN